jgi:tetratricopeptide (TPR) repeat protein
VHIGLGQAAQVDRLEVRWLRGLKETWTNLGSNRIWDITQGDLEAKVFLPPTRNRARDLAQVPPPSSAAPLDKAMLAQFWSKQHAAMDAMKGERNCQKAIPLFREALALNPQHEDSHYYLANCLATSGDVRSAIAELDALARINPQNHRAFQRKGELLAVSASSRAQFEPARQALNTALELNSEETGTLILRGEVMLAEGKLQEAEQDLAHACLANPHAASAWFLRGYIAWAQHNKPQANAMLTATRTARGKDWKPAGSVLEGDVQRRMYNEAGFLNIFEQQWSGSGDAAHTYAPLHEYLERIQ